MGGLFSQAIDRRSRGFGRVQVPAGTNDEVSEPLLPVENSYQEAKRIAEAFHFSGTSHAAKPDTPSDSRQLTVARTLPGLNPAMESVPRAIADKESRLHTQLEESRPKDLVVSDVLIHTLSPEDTLAGLSLRYDVSTHDIRRANFMVDDRINSFTRLVIPPPGSRGVISGLDSAIEVRSSDMDSKNDEQHRLRLVQRLEHMDSSRLGQGAAEYYLTRHNFNLRKALEEAELDAAWEKANSGVLSGPSFAWRGTNSHDSNPERMQLALG